MELMKTFAFASIVLMSTQMALASENTAHNGANCASTSGPPTSSGSSEGFGPGETIICPVVIEHAWSQRRIYYAYVSTTGGYSSSLISCGVRSRNNSGTSYQWKNVSDISTSNPLISNTHNVTVECTNNSPGWTGARAYVQKYRVKHSDSSGN